MFDDTSFGTWKLGTRKTIHLQSVDTYSLDTGQHFSILDHPGSTFCAFLPIYIYMYTPSGKLTQLWRITILYGYYKSPFSIAMLVFQRVYILPFVSYRQL